ncbi:MAG: hypothetical protein GY786_08885 [Proteobacteria bacterium]|nr:hypothetical protein [Pseudomonadota bacterium]
MRLTPYVMAYWVGIFALIWIANALQLMQKYNIDDKSIAIGFFLGVLFMKFAPDPNQKLKQGGGKE